MVFNSKLLISLISAASTLTSSSFISCTISFGFGFTDLGAAEVMLLNITSLSAAVLTSSIWDKVDNLALTVFQ